MVATGTVNLITLIPRSGSMWVGMCEAGLVIVGCEMGAEWPSDGIDRDRVGAEVGTEHSLRLSSQQH